MIYKELSSSNQIVIAISAAVLHSIGQFNCHAQTQVNKITSIQVEFIKGTSAGNPGSPEVVISSSWSCTRKVIASTGAFATSFNEYKSQSGSGNPYIHLRVKYTCVDPTKPPRPSPENLTYSWTSSNSNNATQPVQSGTALKMKMENFPGGVNAASSTRGDQVVWKLSASATQAVDGVTTKFNTSGTAPTVTCINGTLSQTAGSNSSGSNSSGSNSSGSNPGGSNPGGSNSGGSNSGGSNPGGSGSAGFSSSYSNSRMNVVPGRGSFFGIRNSYNSKIRNLVQLGSGGSSNSYSGASARSMRLNLRAGARFRTGKRGFSTFSSSQASGGQQSRP